VQGRQAKSQQFGMQPLNLAWYRASTVPGIGMCPFLIGYNYSKNRGKSVESFFEIRVIGERRIVFRALQKLN
jgi:hypothetical protein